MNFPFRDLIQCVYIYISFRPLVEAWLSGTPFWVRQLVTWYVTTAAFEAIVFTTCVCHSISS